MAWPRLVVTAFGPFGGEPVNASERLLADLADRFPQALAPWRSRIELEVLPCPEGEDAARLVREQAADLLNRHGSALYLLTGQAAGRPHLSLELLAVNRFRGRPLVADGPPAYLADLPDWEALPAALRAAGLPAWPSRDGGEGPCNGLFYALHHQARREGVSVAAGFLHVPVTPAQTLDHHRGSPSWPLFLTRAGLLLALGQLARHLEAGGAAPWNGPRVARIDHLVLPVRDVERSVRFYTRVLGMRVQRDQRGRTALHFGAQKINLHPHPGGHAPAAARPRPGAADLCLLTDQPLPRFIAHLINEGVAVEEGPVSRQGAQGPLRSVYFRDPDGNLVEVANRVEKDNAA